MSLNHLDMAIAFVVVMLAVSLLVTIAVQAVSAVLALRGANLQWGIERLLLTADPDLKDDAARVAETVLRHPLISDSSISSQAWLEKIPLVRQYTIRLTRAKAIRVQELVGLLDVLSDPAALPTAARAAAPRLATIVATARGRLDPQVQSVINQASAVMAQLQSAPAVAPAGPGLAAAPATLQIDGLLDLVPATPAINLARNDIRGWFDTVMDRVSQRFVLHARIWTVAFSIVIAFALHLDSFRLLSTFASNPDVRAQVAGASEALQRAADRTLQAAAAQPPHSADLLAVYRNAVLAAPGIMADSVPGLFTDRPSAIGWLRGALAAQGQPPAEIDAAVMTFDAAVDAGLGTDLDRLADQALTVSGIMKATGFQLVPDPYHSWDISPWWPAPPFSGRPANLHFWGILFSAGLLSLGAPFWYNALKSLSALKPVVATRAEQERAAG